MNLACSLFFQTNFVLSFAIAYQLSRTTQRNPK